MKNTHHDTCDTCGANITYKVQVISFANENGESSRKCRPCANKAPARSETLKVGARFQYDNGTGISKGIVASVGKGLGAFGMRFVRTTDGVKVNYNDVLDYEVVS